MELIVLFICAFHQVLLYLLLYFCHIGFLMVFFVPVLENV